tara:strand:+ start:1635 stop:2357 length:723 start_codon:yes stop_codon:yes gene_type:complete
MAFKLGRETRENLSTPYNKKGAAPVYKKKLEEGIMAEANNDGTIFVDPKLKPGSNMFNRTIRHEQQHMDDMESGRAAYGDEWVMWEDKIYIRKEIDGEKFIDGPAGRLPEGHPDHPWEQSAIQAESVGEPTHTMPDGSVMPGKTHEDSTPMKFLGKITKVMGGAVGGLLSGKKRKDGTNGEESDHSHNEDGEVTPPEEESGAGADAAQKALRKAKAMGMGTSSGGLMAKMSGDGIPPTLG